jgi:arylsulfatase A
MRKAKGVKMRRPNVVFILADDMGYGDFACFNYGLSQTPHLDALLSESVCLTQHYSAAPLCAPARAALLTGRYPLRTGVIDTLCLSRMDCLATREVTIGDLFKQAGYSTGYVGKWHSGNVERKYHPNARGFDEFVGFRAGWWPYYDWRLDCNGSFKEADGRYLTDVFTDEAASFIQRHRREPFFLHLAYNAPHGPFEVPEEDLRPFLESGRHNKGVSHVYAMIKRMDTGVGRILALLEKEGLAENTIVVFTSDNGPQFGGKDDDWRLNRFNCGFRGAKGSVHEGGIRVPLLIRWPAGLAGGRHTHDLVHFTDWLPTLAAAAGMEIPEDLCLDGQNVLPVLRGEAAAKLNLKRFWQWSRGVPVVTHNAAMRDGDWKLVRPGDRLANDMKDWQRDLQLYADVDLHPEKYQDGVPEATGRPPCLGMAPDPALLFNLAADPLETKDLADKHPEVVSRMLRELENWFEAVERDRKTILDKPYRSAETFL